MKVHDIVSFLSYISIMKCDRRLKIKIIYYSNQGNKTNIKNDRFISPSNDICENKLNLLNKEKAMKA